jgi:hypothetical protein
MGRKSVFIVTNGLTLDVEFVGEFRSPIAPKLMWLHVSESHDSCLASAFRREYDGHENTLTMIRDTKGSNTVAARQWVG